MNIRHVYWFAYFDATEPSVRYRAIYPLQHLKKKYGISYSLVWPGRRFGNIAAFAVAYFSALFFRKGDSIIVFQKIYTSGIYGMALKLLLFFRPGNTLYDIDDAEHTRRPAATIHYFMKRCAACSGGSAALMDYIRLFNSNALYLTSPVIDHGVGRAGPANSFHIGWIGYYRAHRESLTRLLFPALDMIDFPLTLTLLGVQSKEELAEIKAYFIHKPNIRINAPLDLNWLDEAAIYSRIKEFTIGVSPLLDTEFNRAKSAFKLKQCLSCGVPVLGSRVGENERFLRDGQNGFLCDTPNDYYGKISAVRNLSADAYTELSVAAANTFPEFSIDHYCRLLRTFYFVEDAIHAPLRTSGSMDAGLNDARPMQMRPDLF